MNSEFVQNLRYKLQKRVRRLNSSSCENFFRNLKLFWPFLKSHSVFQSILDDLEARVPDAKTSATTVCESEHDPEGSNALIGETELEQAAMSYCVLRWCIEKDDASQPIEIGQKYAPYYESKSEAHLEAFRDTFLDSFYEYIDEQLDDQRAVLALLRRYKHKCEWFARDLLYKQWLADTQWGERGLAQHLYEYLHDQGIDLHIEPQSASGEADLIAMQGTDDPLIADAKIFDPDRSKGKSYIAKGFAQVYRYTVDFNEPFGYLIVYLTGKHDLRFSLNEQSQSVPLVVHNNKTIFLMTIDIFPHAESASKRGGLTPIEISESDLIQVASDQSSDGRGKASTT